MLTLYLIYVKNKFVPKIDENNYLDYQGIEKLAPIGNFDIFIYPEYISNLLVIKNGLDNITTLNSNTEEEKIIINKSNKNLAILENMDLSNFGYSMSQHLNIRANSFFEDNMIMGRPGLFILKHINQILNLSISIWFVLLNDKYFYYSKTLDSQNLIIRTVIGLIVSLIYFSIMLFLTRSNLKIFNLISSTESNKNEELIKKIIHLSTLKHSNQVNRIAEEFRKMCFDICILTKSDKFQNTLGKKILKDIVDISFLRFKEVDEKNLKNSKDKLNLLRISISENFEEFRSYVKSVSGQNINEQDLESMFHLIENRESLKKSKSICFLDIYDIWGGLILLASLENDKCVRMVIDYFQSLKKLRDDEFNLDSLKELLDWAKDYISKEDKDFLFRECKEFKSNFNKECFIGFMSAYTNSQSK